MAASEVLGPLVGPFPFLDIAVAPILVDTCQQEAG